MARFIGDSSRFSFKYESGTYANASGTEQWAGLVQTSSVKDEINKIKGRYVGGNTRNVERHIDGATDATASFSSWVQDWRMLGFALGSIVTTGSPYVHTLSEVNSDSSNGYTSGTDAPFVSFSVQDAKRFNSTGLNHLKTVNGCMVNTLAINWAMGEPVTMDVDTIGQSVTYGTGASWTPTPNTERPYLWADTVFNIPSGTPVRYVKSSSFKINQNMVGDHYCNGSKTIELPYPGNRDYDWTLTVDSNTDQAKAFYEQYYKGGSEFNAHIRCAKSATRALNIWLSGCEIPDMDDPTSFENAQEMNITIVPKTAKGEATDSIAVYGAW